MAYPWHKAELEGLLSRKDRLPHALLLRGPQGIGKLAFAESVARALLCERPLPDGGGCGQCTACGWMAQGSHPDLRRLEPESLAEANEGEESTEKRGKASSQISVAQVRGIASFINMSSHRGGMKIALIHPADALNVNAANALLKNLEEPPPQTLFLLVAHRWHHLLPTVRSRCQHVPLPPPAPAAARDWLAAQGVSDPGLALAQAGGAPLVAAGLDEGYWQRRSWFLKAISGKGLDALALADQLRDEAPALVVRLLQKWAYDVVCHKVAGVVSYNPDFAAPIAAIAGRVDLVEAARFLRWVVGFQRIVAHPLNTRLFFEDVLLTYAELLKARPIALAA